MRVCPDVCCMPGLASLKTFHVSRRRRARGTQRHHAGSALLLLLQPGSRGHADFQSGCGDLEASPVSAALGLVVFDAHVLRIGTLYAQIRISGFLEKASHMATRGPSFLMRPRRTESPVAWRWEGSPQLPRAPQVPPTSSPSPGLLASLPVPWGYWNGWPLT